MSRKLEKMAASPETERDLLLELVEKDSEYAEIVAKNPSADLDILKRIYEILSQETLPVLAASSVLQNKNVDADFIRYLSNECPQIHTEEDSDYPEENCYPVLLAKHLATPIEILSELVKSPFYMVRERLAARPDLPSEIATTLATDPICHVRRILAANAYTTFPILDILANDEDMVTRLKVALNSSTSLESLNALSRDIEDTIKFAAITNPKFAN